ncbi:MAG: hypothetical protein ACYS22_08720 [Planctomycetota bacterium]|jgi:membrane associated rhomboid family serine protease
MGPLIFLSGCAGLTVGTLFALLLRGQRSEADVAIVGGVLGFVFGALGAVLGLAVANTVPAGVTGDPLLHATGLALTLELAAAIGRGLAAVALGSSIGGLVGGALALGLLPRGIEPRRARTRSPKSARLPEPLPRPGPGRHANRNRRVAA